MKGFHFCIRSPMHVCGPREQLPFCNLVRPLTRDLRHAVPAILEPAFDLGCASCHGHVMLSMRNSITMMSKPPERSIDLQPVASEISTAMPCELQEHTGFGGRGGRLIQGWYKEVSEGCSVSRFGQVLRGVGITLVLQ